MTNFPWPMDKPVEEIDSLVKTDWSMDIFDLANVTNYLLTRLKKAESERDHERSERANLIIRLDTLKHGFIEE